MDGIIARGKLPIICGGTGFYIDALLGVVNLSDVPANLALRAKQQFAYRVASKMMQKLDEWIATHP